MMNKIYGTALWKYIRHIGDLRFDDFEISAFVKHVWTSLHVGLASARQQRRYVLERHHYGMEFIDAASASD